jgi:hypothetical protein
MINDLKLKPRQVYVLHFEHRIPYDIHIELPGRADVNQIETSSFDKPLDSIN